jgi:hypothetical protein
MAQSDKIPFTDTASLDFGAFPGSSHVALAVTGQDGIEATSCLKACICPTATADHSVDEHVVESIQISAGNIVAGTGFTIYGKNLSTLGNTLIYGTWTVRWSWA